MTNLPPGSFDVIPKWAFRLRRAGKLSGVDLEALAIVARYAESGKRLFLRSVYYVAGLENMDRKNLGRSIARLEALGLLTRVKHPKYRRPAYWINFEDPETPSARTAARISEGGNDVRADGANAVAADGGLKTPSCGTAQFGPDRGARPPPPEIRRPDGRRALHQTSNRLQKGPGRNFRTRPRRPGRGESAQGAGGGRRVKMFELFAGIGGFSLGFQRAGFEVAGLCEIDESCRGQLAANFPDAVIFEDVRTLTGGSINERCGAIDVLCGGFPCQPHSLAGRRGGARDDRDLWPEMRRIIGELRPAWVCAENVTGLESMVFAGGPPRLESATGHRTADGFDHVATIVRSEEMYLAKICQDLDSLGYAVAVPEIPAAGVGAPQLRYRLVILAHADGAGREKHGGPVAIRPEHETAECRGGAMGDAAGGRGGKGRGLPDFPVREIGFHSEWTGARFVQGPDGKFRRLEPGICPLAYGVPGRVDQIRALGNAFVPQIPEMIARSILAAMAAEEAEL